MYMENDPEKERNWLFLQGLNARVVISIPHDGAIRLEECTDIQSQSAF